MHNEMLISNLGSRSVLCYLRQTMLVLCCLMVSLVQADHEVNQSSEHQSKSLFLYNLSKFSKWPADESDDMSASVFYICVLGDYPLHHADVRMEGKTAAGADIVMRNIKDISSSSSCDILFIGQSEKQRLDIILKELDVAPILIVSDIAGFAEAGGCIELYTEEAKLVFSINMAAVHKTGVKLSAQLLEMARAVINKRSDQ